MITIQINDQAVLEALRRLQARTGNLKPVLQEIGEVLIESTKRRFATGTAPDGTPWAPNSKIAALPGGLSGRADRHVGIPAGEPIPILSLTPRAVGWRGAKNCAKLCQIARILTPVATKQLRSE